eukprot:364168-Chlamydomonas_euryale.AAC.9
MASVLISNAFFFVGRHWTPAQVAIRRVHWGRQFTHATATHGGPAAATSVSRHPPLLKRPAIEPSGSSDDAGPIYRVRNSVAEAPQPLGLEEAVDGLEMRRVGGGAVRGANEGAAEPLMSLSCSIIAPLAAVLLMSND